MSDEIDFLDSVWDGNERGAIQANAKVLAAVCRRLEELEATTTRQADELVHLRAMVLGLGALVKRRLEVDGAELDQEFKVAYEELVPPPPAPASDPYRGLPAEVPSQRVDHPEAKGLIKAAQELHYAKRFAEAVAIYQDIVTRYPTSKQAAVAAQQIENLEGR